MSWNCHAAPAKEKETWLCEDRQFKLHVCDLDRNSLILSRSGNTTALFENFRTGRQNVCGRLPWPPWVSPGGKPLKQFPKLAQKFEPVSLHYLFISRERNHQGYLFGLSFLWGIVLVDFPSSSEAIIFLTIAMKQHHTSAHVQRPL